MKRSWEILFGIIVLFTFSLGAMKDESSERKKPIPKSIKSDKACRPKALKIAQWLAKSVYKNGLRSSTDIACCQKAIEAMKPFISEALSDVHLKMMRGVFSYGASIAPKDGSVKSRYCYNADLKPAIKTPSEYMGTTERILIYTAVYMAIKAGDTLAVQAFSLLSNHEWLAGSCDSYPFFKKSAAQHAKTLKGKISLKRFLKKFEELYVLTPRAYAFFKTALIGLSSDKKTE